MRASVIRAGALSLCREPVTVFFLVAAAVMVGGVFARSPTMTQISIDEGAVESTRARLAATLKRAPSPEEVEGAIESMVDGEVLYREALRLGLDRRDPIVRRRLIQKMEMVLEQSSGVPDVSEQVLRSWYDANVESFSVPEQRSFSQMQLGEVGGAELSLLEARANELGIQADDSVVDFAGKPSAHSRAQRGMNEAETARRFGEEVARVVFSVGEGSWTAARGAHGWMLVRVDRIVPAGATAFDQVRGQVRELRAAERRESMRRRNLERLRATYDVEVAR